MRKKRRRGPPGGRRGRRIWAADDENGWIRRHERGCHRAAPGSSHVPCPGDTLTNRLAGKRPCPATKKLSRSQPEPAFDNTTYSTG